jgi:hypothetical protein
VAEYIRVQGDKENICNCIDFYQGLTKVGLMGVKELRKSYLDMYLSDYVQRCKDTLQKRKNKIEVDKAVSEETNKNMDIFRSMVNTPEEGISSPPIENKEEIERVPHGVILNPIEDESDIDYVKNGVFLEDLILPNSKSERVSTEEEIERVPHGVYVEDLKSGVDVGGVQEEGVFEDSDEEEDNDSSTQFDFEDDDSDEDFDEVEDSDNSAEFDFGDSDEVEDSTQPDFEDDDSDEDSDEDSDDVEDNDNPTKFDFEDGNSDEEFISFKDSFGSVPEEDDDDDFVFVDYQNSDDTRLKNVNEEQDILRSERQDEKSRVKDRIIDNAEETGFAESNVVENKPKVYDYKNVRDFVKKNPGCSYSDVKECFSMKEIQKALLTTKIVEKKNKLYVV